MKLKYLGLLIITLILFTTSLIFIPTISNAAVANNPIYDASFNNGQGAFFANGTPITISDKNGITTVSWTNETQAITESTRIFGGGQAGTSFNSSNITMESGTVSHIYGGGFSTDENNSANVDSANINFNGGTVKNTIYGGGLLYTKVNSTNITINDGAISFVTGGGHASATINGINYNTGTEENPQDSKTIVKNTNLIVNSGMIDALYGGGQGYSNTEKTNVTINGGNIEYITAGGANGYTGIANITFNGGKTSVYQSVNRGTVDLVNLRTNNGKIETLYVGGENVSDVTGTLNGINLYTLGGKITNLNAGKSNDSDLIIKRPDYNIVISSSVVENNNITNAPIINIDNIILAFTIAAILIIFILLLVFALFID